MRPFTGCQVRLPSWFIPACGGSADQWRSIEEWRWIFWDHRGGYSKLVQDLPRDVLGPRMEITVHDDIIQVTGIGPWSYQSRWP